MSNPIFGCAVLASGLLAGAAIAAETAPAPEDYLAAARPTIEAANADWAPAMKRKDAKAIASFYANDGVLVGPGGQAIQGREAVEKFYAQRLEGAVRFVRGTLVQDGVVLAPGPMIYEWGHADVEVERDGKVLHSAGNYVTVWKRNASGTWQISRNLAM
ncbi:MAG: YybH family protein [Betaproteobacteria bacterium]